MNIASHIRRIRSELPQGVTLVAVSKYHPAAAIREAYAAGQRVFGENKAQELAGKYEELPRDIEWHFIGHLQTNKVKYIAPFVHTIESVDSLKLLQEIDRQGLRCGRTIRVLLEVHIAEEETKFGLSPAGCEALLRDGCWRDCRNVRIGGLMGMATHTDDETKVREEFRRLHGLFLRLKETYFPADDFFTELSMGMSHDYRLAVEEGSTLVRIGSAIFGDRIP